MHEPHRPPEKRLGPEFQQYSRLEYKHGTVDYLRLSTTYSNTAADSRVHVLLALDAEL